MPQKLWDLDVPFLLLMSQRVQFDIYVKPADANESQYKSKNESACISNLICAKIGLLAYRSSFFIHVIYKLNNFDVRFSSQLLQEIFGTFLLKSGCQQI